MKKKKKVVKKPLMSEARFFKELAALRKNGWKLLGGEAIRCARGDCPITAVAKAQFNKAYKALPANLRGALTMGLDEVQAMEAGDYERAALMLGLDDEIVGDMVGAADESYAEDDENLNDREKRFRRKMLTALHLPQGL